MDNNIITAGNITAIVDSARQAHASGRTAPLEWRRATLNRLQQLVRQHEDELLAAMAADFGKPRLEAWATEIGFTVSDIAHTLAHLSDWSRPRAVPTPLTAKPGSSRIEPQPKGLVCVIAPWNYPFQLLVVPMVAAIAAGNAVVGKPSELAPNTSAVTAKVIRALNDPAVAVVEGGVAETTELLAQRFDHIIYTGGGRVAKIVLQAAAEHLTPVTLELGGKSPVIVSRNANIEVAAKRIAWGKFLNAGQTCIAPDYVLVEQPVHDQLVRALGDAVTAFYGADPQQSADFARIVNSPHFHRLEKLIHSGTVAVGGTTDADTRYIAPTVLTGVTRDDPVMGEEIFGPVLPVIAVGSLPEAVQFVNAGERPLALYVFTEDEAEQRLVLDGTVSGGACVNATIMHVAIPDLPFGGVGPSGMGAYHGRAGFDTFSHLRSVYSKGTRMDPPLLYPPYDQRKEKMVRTGLSMPDPRDMVARLRTRLGR